MSLNMYFVKTVIVWLPVILNTKFVKACNITAVNECTAILSRGTDIDVLTEGISAIPAEHLLKKMCSGVQNFTDCFKPQAESCKKNVIFAMTFGTIENTVNYLCVEGYRDIMRYKTCWNQTEVINDTTTCHVNQNIMIHSLQRRALQVGKLKLRHLWCEILENTTECMGDAVETRCGSAPGCVMRTMMARALVGLAGLMQCPESVPCMLDNRNTTGSVASDVAVTGNTTTVASTAVVDTDTNTDATSETEDNNKNMSSRHLYNTCLIYIVLLNWVSRFINI